MRFTLTGSVQRDAHVQLIDKLADGLRLHEPRPETDNVYQVVTTDIRKIQAVSPTLAYPTNTGTSVKISNLGNQRCSRLPYTLACPV